MSKRQSSLLFFFALIISGTILLQMLIYCVSILAGWNAKFNLVAACHSLLRAFGLSSLEFALDVLIVYTLFISIWKITSQFVQASRMKKRFQLYRNQTLSTELNLRCGSRGEDIIVLSYPAPFAITMGFMCPQIVITTGLRELLTDDELEAVLTHELYHKENRDPLKIFLLSLFSSMMWYIPILKWFHLKYLIIQEIMADEYAIKVQGTSENVGSALLKMLKVGKHAKMPFTYASFADTSVNYRIEYILNPIKDIQIKLPVKVVMISFFIFSLICMLFIYALA